MAMSLSDELAEEILLRFPPENPGSLVRAALACKRALRLAADPGFRRRYRAFHGAAPMLGFFRNTMGARGCRLEDLSTVARFVPTAAASSCLPRAELRDCRVVDARHGRVLLRSGAACWNSRFVVWDPITGEMRRLPLMPVTLYPANWNAAVLCTAAGCDHLVLDCHGSRFTVVFVAIKEMKVHNYTYSTEDVLWSWPPNPGAHQHDGHLHLEPSALVGDALYFVLQPDNKILEYNVGTREVAVIHPPRGCFSEHRVVLMTAEDGGLGVAAVCKSKLCLWSREIGSDKDARWAPRRVIELKTLMPMLSLSTSPVVAGYANGIGIIFVRTSVGFFMIDLKSSRVKKVRNVIGGSSIFPYMSFWNPALGGTSTGDGSRGASSALPRGSGSQGGDEGSDDDDDEATPSDEDDDDDDDDDDDSEAMGSDEDDDDDDDSEAMASGADDDEEEEDGFTNLASLLFLVLGEFS